MTLKEAIESGKPFKRKDWPEYYVIKDGQRYNEDGTPTYGSMILFEHAVADDWIVKREPRTYYVVQIQGRQPEVFQSEAYAKNFAHYRSDAEVIKVVEVLER